MASLMKSAGGGMEKMKKMATLAKSFSENVTDLVQKCGKTSSSLVNLVATVSEMVISQNGDISTLKGAVSEFRESITELKSEINDDLGGNLKEGKEIIGDGDNKGKPGKAEELVLRIATVIEASLKLTEKFLECVEELQKIISIMEENRWEEAVTILQKIKANLGEIKENIDEIKNAIKGDKEGKGKDSGKGSDKKDDVPKSKSMEKPKEGKSLGEKEDEESESCFSRVFCCCCRKK